MYSNPNPATETHLWADRYDRDLEDVFAIQEEVAREIAAAVHGKIEAEAYEHVLRRSGPDLTAYEYVLRGERMREHERDTAGAVPFSKSHHHGPDVCAG